MLLLVSCFDHVVSEMHKIVKTDETRFPNWRERSSSLVTDQFSKSSHVFSPDPITGLEMHLGGMTLSENAQSTGLRSLLPLIAGEAVLLASPALE